ncbi:MAG TPA: TAXI family TRAP transporter solute-binding subunit [Ferrovibrio sp.]|uniref:TAXI family TRAP transporter solute-binding subunit n=1 Tax=Ferrovibrio sp. TaxID=1917215 RepID=UPI002B4ABF7B|nr:TAXI family TRAP transporter solute-binding subunit [Ferrovibrio sp.]HLT79323.1 TAXI family TRAP transporter solute-binding subunit [Ferrovibrio sp.]
MIQRIKRRGGFAVAVTAGLLAASFGGDASAQTYKLMTGPQGGVWVPLGGTLKAMFEKAIPGSTVQTLPGAGIANVKGVQEGKADFGFGNSISTVDAVNGKPPFTEKATNVCQIANLYPQYFQVVVLADSGINKIEDLKGKAIAVQTRGNTAEAISQHILQAHGLSYDAMGKVNFMASYNDAASLLKDGHAQVFTLGTTIPAASVMDLASARDMKLIPITDEGLAAMKKINAGYNKVIVPAGTYPKQDKDLPVIGYSTHFITQCKLPEDKIYAVTKAMATQIADLAAVNKAMAKMTAKEMAEDIGVPLHPGAAKYYREVGALK